jgi:hypothetical protein
LQGATCGCRGFPRIIVILEPMSLAPTQHLEKYLRLL